MNEKKKTKDIISQNKKPIIAVALALMVIIGGTYAWLTLTLNGTKSNILRAGTLQLTLDDTTSDGISLENTVPMSDTKGLATTAYTFTLKNSGSTGADYTIYLDDLGLETTETRMADKYVKYSLVKNSGEATTALLTTIGSNPNRILDTGTINADTTNTYTLRIWIDSDADNEVMGTVFSAQLRVDAAQSADEVAVNKVCKRATTLHNDGIHTYGNLGTAGESLVSGDAFDCDVNNDGTYDSDTERFYYVTDMNATTAVMIYYNNTAAGQPSNSTTFAYDAGGDSYINGPATAVAQLPTTAQWSNVSLTNTTRDLTDEKGTVRKTEFSYAGYAARLLTTQEVGQACEITVGNQTSGELDSCTYLMENTYYQSTSLKYGYWLENPVSNNSSNAWLVFASDRFVGRSNVRNVNDYGARPAIEILKSDILN